MTRSPVSSLAAALCLVFAGCARCGSSATPDAAPRAEHEQRKHIDVRSALLLAYPEYRGTATLETRVRYQRVMPGLTDEALAAEARRLHWQPADGGWTLANLQVERVAPDTLEISLAYDTEQLAYLYVTPNSLTSAEFAYYLPKVPATHERFFFDVRYVTSPEHAQNLVEQAVRVMRETSQWSLDGGGPTPSDAGLAPHDETFVVDGVNGAHLTFQRSGGKVFVEYALETLGT